MPNDRGVVALINGGQEWNEFQKLQESLDFTDADLKSCDLNNRQLQRDADFDRAEFNRIDTSGTDFQGGATFKRAKFRQRAEIRPASRPDVTLDFSEAEFFDEVQIGPRPHVGPISFTRAKFYGKVIVGLANHDGGIDFWGAEFHEDVVVRGDNGELIFVRARFGIDKAITATFRSAIFHRGVDFSKATFLGPANFENAEFKGSSSFVECTFHKAPNFHDATLHQGTRFSPQHDFADLFLDTESAFAANAYRSLKLAMNAQHAHNEELGFFLLEMRSAANLQKPSVKRLHQAYDLISNYGLSVKRPLIAFAAVNIVVGLLYSALAGRGWGAWDPELLRLTLYGAIPFAPALRPNIDVASLFPSAVQWAVPVLVALQGLLNAALLFLTGLGLRNLFKIK